jgi:outer membrane receptor for ferrienterochelin and colicin
MYGSGAFGGVVNVVDERIPTGLAESETHIRLQYDAVNQGKTVGINHSDAVDLSAGNELHWRVSASHFRSNEYELPLVKVTVHTVYPFMKSMKNTKAMALGLKCDSAELI